MLNKCGNETFTGYHRNLCRQVWLALIVTIQPPILRYGILLKAQVITHAEKGQPHNLWEIYPSNTIFFSLMLLLLIDFRKVYTEFGFRFIIGPRKWRKKKTPQKEVLQEYFSVNWFVLCSARGVCVSVVNWWDKIYGFPVGCFVNRNRLNLIWCPKHRTDNN